MPKIIFFFGNKNPRIIRVLKIRSKLLVFRGIIKTVIYNYNFKLIQKIKIIIINYNFMFKVKIVINNYSFNFF